MKILATVLALLTTNPALAVELSGSCADLEGHSIGYQKGKRIDEADRTTVTFNYKVKGQTATIEIPAQGLRENASVIGATAKQVVLFVAYPEAVWIHTLYPVANQAIINRATTGFGLDQSAAMGSIFTATCNWH